MMAELEAEKIIKAHFEMCRDPLGEIRREKIGLAPNPNYDKLWGNPGDMRITMSSKYVGVGDPAPTQTLVSSKMTGEN